MTQPQTLAGAAVCQTARSPLGATESAPACQRETRATADGSALGSLPERLTLRAGQSFHVYARPGVVLHMTAGSVRITPAPRWLAATSWAQQIILRRGMAHVVERAGWMLVEADQRAELACHDIAPEPPRWGWLRRWLGE